MTEEKLIDWEKRVQKVEERLIEKLNEGLPLNFEGEPTLELPTGEKFIIRNYYGNHAPKTMKDFPNHAYHEGFIVERDYGLTCKPLLYKVSLHEVAILIEQVTY